MPPLLSLNKMSTVMRGVLGNLSKYSIFFAKLKAENTCLVHQRIVSDQRLVLKVHNCSNPMVALLEFNRYAYMGVKMPGKEMMACSLPWVCCETSMIPDIPEVVPLAPVPQTVSAGSYLPNLGDVA